MSPLARRAFARASALLAISASFAGAPAAAQYGFTAPTGPAVAPCNPFSGFPMALNLGQAFDGRDGISSRCGFQRVQDGLNLIAGQRGQPNGIATLDSSGLVPLAQIPATVSLPTAVPSLIISGDGSTGNVSGMSVKAPGAPSGLALRDWMTFPNIVSTTSPNKASAYSDADSGRAALSVINSDGSPATNQERYAGFFRYEGPGTGDPAVINSAFGLGAASIKKNFETTTVPGQSIGINVTARGGYHGADAAASLPQFGGYNPAGDVSAILTNSLVTSSYSQNAILEGVSFYAEGGRFDNTGNIHSINVQLGSMRMLTPQGQVANPGIGLALSATGGGLGYAIQANNTARPGSYGYVPGSWQGFARYNYDNGTTAYDAWRVDQDGTMFFGAPDGTNRKIRVQPGGTFEILNSTGVSNTKFDEAGTLYMGASARIAINNKVVLGPQQGAIANNSDPTTNAILAALRAHGLIASQ